MGHGRDSGFEGQATGNAEDYSVGKFTQRRGRTSPVPSGERSEGPVNGFRQTQRMMPDFSPWAVHALRGKQDNAMQSNKQGRRQGRSHLWGTHAHHDSGPEYRTDEKPLTMESEEPFTFSRNRHISRFFTSSPFPPRPGRQKFPLQKKPETKRAQKSESAEVGWRQKGLKCFAH